MKGKTLYIVLFTFLLSCNSNRTDNTKNFTKVIETYSKLGDSTIIYKFDTTTISSTPYKSGKLNGVAKEYYNSGKIKYKSRYRNDTLLASIGYDSLGNINYDYIPNADTLTAGEFECKIINGRGSLIYNIEDTLRIHVFGIPSGNLIVNVENASIKHCGYKCYVIKPTKINCDFVKISCCIKTSDGNQRNRNELFEKTFEVKNQ